MAKGRPRGSKNRDKITGDINKRCAACKRECKQWAYVTILQCYKDVDAKKNTSTSTDVSPEEYK